MRCVLVPLGVLTSAEITLWVPGHQATNQPLATVALTFAPSSSVSVVPVTFDPVCPSANERA